MAWRKSGLFEFPGTDIELPVIEKLHIIQSIVLKFESMSRWLH